MKASKTIKARIAELNAEIAGGAADADFLKEWADDLEALLPFIDDNFDLEANKYIAPKAAGRPELRKMSIWMA